MKIAITGSTGMVGTALVKHLKEQGHEVIRIVRSHSKHAGEERQILWNIATKNINASSLEGMDAIIHLAGANIAGKRWNSIYKDLIYSSRIKSTEFLVETITKLKSPPKVFISASAIGYYGNHPADVTVTEDSHAANDYLAKVCRDWEKASELLSIKGIRTVYMRIGAVLDKSGGALAKMMPIFKLGVGGTIGAGKQMFSWIALDEIPHMVDFILRKDKISGPVNFVTPNPVTNKEFTKALGEAIDRPTVLPVPPFALRIMFGEMADALLINGVKVIPERLQKAGYKFKYPKIKDALAVSL